VVIYRMLRELDPLSYCLISTDDHSDKTPIENPSQLLACTYHYLPPPFRFARGYRFGLQRPRESVNLLLAIIEYSRRIAEIVRRERCEAVVACTGDVTILPAGYLASRLARVPFYAYVFDHYSYREWDNPHFGAFRNLMTEIRKLGQPGINLHLYTNQPDETLERENVRGPIVKHPQESMTEMPRVQLEADILFLPLAFDSPYPGAGASGFIPSPAARAETR
jgi:hypothetical protein